MSRPKKLNRIRKSDHARVLTTETLPYETPVIFSNEGFYNNIRSNNGNVISIFLRDALVFNKLGKTPNSTIPYSYKIRKNSIEFRRLSLLHPTSQWKIKEFYEKYDNVILHYCSQSPSSIRAPEKIASTFYRKSAWENIHKYKTGTVAELWADSFARHSPSYFAYRGYDRLYKFFDSRDYFEQELRFSRLVTLDVSKCFDSIYTHCLSWALKEKAFTKKHVSVDSTFAQEFDALMRHANHNETNGIVIGPEFSRIFAELMFQSIDRLCISRLNHASQSLQFGVHYCFRRYVDDIFIFARDDQTANAVYKCYSDSLLTYNLHTNSAKLVRLSRPFITVKSRITRAASDLANEFFDGFLEPGDSTATLIPKAIYSTWRLTRSFINSVKSLCANNNVNYDEVSSYLVSVFVERVKKLANVSAAVTNTDEQKKYRDACLVLVDVMYFLYAVSPSVSASYKLCTASIVLKRFFERFVSEYDETLRQRLYELTERSLEDDSIRNEVAVERFLSLESVNIALAIRELGHRYLLPIDVVEKLFIRKNVLTYFDIVACLFYVRNEDQYLKVRRKVISAADKILLDLSDIRMNTEKACLLLDLLCCPFIDDTRKTKWIKRLYAVFTAPAPTGLQISEFIASASTNFWFVNWNDVDLLNSLEKKELKQAY